LSVLSRTTAVNYERAGKTLQQIASDLGVDYVLEGSVRWERRQGGPERVRVTPQLVRASDDTHIWGESYDATMEEVFRVQSEIAEQVVGRLGMQLLGDERQAMRDVPTQNVEAYHAYHRGMALFTDYQTEEEAQTAARMFELAIQHDPAFVQAHARASMIYSTLAHSEWDRSPANIERAKNAAERALELDPDGPWGHAAMGYYHYWCLKEYESALAAFERAKGGPDDVVKIGVAFILRRLGRFEDALADFEEIHELDPQNMDVVFNLFITNTLLGRFESAFNAIDRLITLAPDRIEFRLQKLWLTLLSGDRRGAEMLARTVESEADATPAHERHTFIAYYSWCLAQ
ncbi:MAG: hypothetical protein GWO21_15570, partial [Gammaproteobacteria bacterium]|nr:hypothetical protein [Gammaproteobacteria bacterium]